MANIQMNLLMNQKIKRNDKTKFLIKKIMMEIKLNGFLYIQV